MSPKTIEEAAREADEAARRAVVAAEKADAAAHNANKAAEARLAAATASTKAAAGAQTDSNETSLDLKFDYAWKWFSFHADQRTKVFNYFVVVAGVLAAGIATAAAKDRNWLVAGMLGILGAAVSCAFILLDFRNKYLVALGEHALKALEGTIFGSTGALLLLRKDPVRTTQAGPAGTKNLPLRWVGHRWLLPAVEIFFVAAFAFVSCYAFEQDRLATQGKATADKVVADKSAAEREAQVKAAAEKAAAEKAATERAAAERAAAEKAAADKAAADKAAAEKASVRGSKKMSTRSRAKRSPNITPPGAGP